MTFFFWGGEGEVRACILCFQRVKTARSLYRTDSGDDAVDFLVVGVASVPREAVLKVDVGLEFPLEDNTLDDDPQSYDDQTTRNGPSGHRYQQSGHKARRVAAVVNQVKPRARYVQALTKYLHRKVTQYRTVFIIIIIVYYANEAAKHITKSKP